MSRQVRFDQYVDLLVDFYEDNTGGRVRAVIFRRQEDAQYATHLAAIMGVPVQQEPAIPTQRAS